MKVQWRHRHVDEAMWEVKSDMHHRYPQSFTSTCTYLLSVVDNVMSLFMRNYSYMCNDYFVFPFAFSCLLSDTGMVGVVLNTIV